MPQTLRAGGCIRLGILARTASHSASRISIEVAFVMTMELLLVVGFLRFARRVVGVRWGVLEDGLLFKLRLQH